jgi:hypothetical protein
MNNKFLLGIASVVIAVICVSCNSPKQSSSPPQVGGKWDIGFFQLDPQVTTYLVEVTASGGSGVAQVQVLNDKGDNSGPSLVTAQSPIPLGACGLDVIFADTGAVPLDLKNGDSWSITVAYQAVVTVQANPSNTSAAHVSTSGTFTCVPPPCPRGVYQSGVPLSLPITQLAGVEASEFDLVDINQSVANFTGAIAEQKILSWTLINLNTGDTVQICYERKTASDEKGESFFRVRLVNAVDFELIEDLTTPAMTSAAKTTCYKFSALETNARVDFIFSLANLNDMVWIDSLKETVNGNVVFSEDFETGALENHLEVRIPANMVGQASVSSVLPLQGNYSFRAIGGRTLSISGAVLQGAGNILSSVVGALGSDSVGGLFGNAQGLTFNINDGVKGGYFGAFAGEMPLIDSVIGTFSGQQGACVEYGEFIVGIENSEFYPLTEPWAMVLNGTAQNCGDTTSFTKSFQPFTPLQQADKVYSDPNSPVLDDDLNSYQMSGRELGSTLYFTMGDYAQTDYQNALFYGIISASIEPGLNIQLGNTTILVGDTTIQVGNTVYPRPDLVGAFTGWLGFKSGWKCQSSGIFRVYWP